MESKLRYGPSVFELDSPKNNFKTGVVAWDSLVNRLNDGEFNLVSPIIVGQITKINVDNKSLKKYFFVPSEKKPYNLHFINNAVDKKYKDRYYFKTLVSTERSKKISKKNCIYSYNLNIKQSLYKYRLLFPFNDLNESDDLSNQYGVVIEANNFDHLEVLLIDLGLDFSKDKKEEIIKMFNKAFYDAGDDRDKFDEIYEKAPNFVIQSRGKDQLLKDLKSLLSGTVDERGTNEEIAVLNILKAILRLSKTEDEFLNTLLKGFDDGGSILSQLIYRLDGNNFRELVTLAHQTWLNSSYAEVNPLKNKIITESSPVLLNYSSDKKLGFHTDNASMKWNTKTNKVNVNIKVKTGTFESIPRRRGSRRYTVKKEIIDTHKYTYHPFSPIVILNSANPKFIYKDENQKDAIFTLLPVFVLYAKEETAFWENVITATEYAVDILTTISGVGNIIKVGRLAKILKAGHSLIRRSKAATETVKGIKTFAGIIEVSSGVGKTLLKLSGKNDTPLGRAITKYLFYLEVLSLSSELTAALDAALRKSASEVIEHSDAIKKTAKNADEVKYVDDVIEHLNIVSRNFKIDNFIARSIKNGKTIGNISKKIIIRELHNVTSTATEVARAIKKGKIKLIKLDEAEFFEAIKLPGETIDDIKDVLASQIDEVIFIKNKASLDKAFGEIIHEGQHALDFINKLFDEISLLRKETKSIVHDKVSMSNFVDKMTDKQVIELRARIAEREFQLAAKQPTDFSSVEAMISFIYKKY